MTVKRRGKRKRVVETWLGKAFGESYSGNEKGIIVPGDVPFYVIVLDTPSIKQFVFGTDALAEVRGASAILDELNQSDTERVLREQLNRYGGRVDKVYANGGSGQFIIRNCEPTQIDEAIAVLTRLYSDKTGREVRLATGVAACDRAENYRQAVRIAHFRMRGQREMATACRTANLLPFIKECQSASHLPASRTMDWGDDGTQFLSDASGFKRDSARRARRFGVWNSWMKSLAAAGTWPDEDQWDTLRCEDFARIAEASGQSGNIGLVYADGNAMGRLVQEWVRSQKRVRVSHV